MEILRLDRTTVDAQVRVYHTAFNKQEPIEETKARWVKKHYNNPIEDSLVFGAIEDGELVGLNAYQPSCYTIDGEKVFLLQSCESGVLPSQQGKGIWGKIVRYAVDYIEKNTKYQAVIGFPNYRNSYPGFKKMGWKTLYEMNNMILVNNVKCFAQSLFGKKQILQLIARISVIQRMPVFVYSLFHKDVRVEECDITDIKWNDDANVVSVDHSENWCRWKADYKQISSLSLRSGEKVLANCLYDIGHYEGNNIIRLEYFSKTSDTNIGSKSLLSHLLNYLKKTHPEAAFVRVWTMNDTELNRDLRQLFFLKSSHPNPFIITEPNIYLAEKDWSLSFFDLD